MFEFKVENLLKCINKLTINTIEVTESIELSFGKVNIINGNISKTIFCVIKNGDSFQFSENLLLKIFDVVLINNVQFIIHIEDLQPIDSLPIADEILLNSIWNPLLPEYYDFSNSIYAFFNSNNNYICLNDIIKIPINFFDLTTLLEDSNIEPVTVTHFYLKITNIEPINKENMFSFHCNNTKVIYKSKPFVIEKTFNINDNFHRFSDELLEFQSKIIPILRTQSLLKTQLKLIKNPIVHINGPLSSGKRYLVESFSKIIGYHYIVVKFCDIYSQSPSVIDKKFDRFISLVKTGNYICLHFENFDKFFINIDHGNREKFDPRSVKIFSGVLDQISVLENKEIVIFLSTIDDIPVEIDQRILIRHSIEFMRNNDRAFVIRNYINSNENIVEEIVKLSKKTSVVELINVLKSITKSGCTEKDLIGAFKLSISGGSETAAMNLEPVTWRDIGGQQQIIDEILAIVQLTTSQHKPVPGFKVRKSGILLYGEPGTGKTLIAKAIAYECSLNFISVKGPELLNMYVGQTEENVRSLFSRVRAMMPCLLFCDELDSLIPRRGFSGDSGGVMDRVVSQFSVEIDSINNEEDVRVIIMGATNRPDLIDPALLRNGRFDKIFHVAGGLDKTNKLEILKSQTYKLNMDNDVDLDEIIDLFPNGVWTGARIYGLVSTAVMNAIKRTIKMIENKLLDDDCALIINRIDFIQALESDL